MRFFASVAKHFPSSCDHIVFCDVSFMYAELLLHNFHATGISPVAICCIVASSQNVFAENPDIAVANLK